MDGEFLALPNYIQLLQRQSYREQPFWSVAANTFGTVASVGISIPIPNGQAIRVVRAHANIASPGANAGLLTLHSFSLWLVPTVPGVPVGGKAYEGGAVKLGDAGVDINWSENELFLWNDYLEIGSTVPGASLVAQADVDNPTAAIHGGAISVTALIERFLLKPIGHLGYP